MIKVEFKLSEDKQNLILKMSGHAGQAENGRDLVCASASILAYQMAQVVSDMYAMKKLRKKPTVRLGAGEAIIVAKPLKSTFNEITYAYLINQTGFKVLAHNFPEFVSLSTLDVFKP